MVWARQARAAVREVGARGRDIRSTVKAGVEDHYGDNRRVKQAAERLDRIRATTTTTSHDATERARAGFSNAQSTTVGRKIGAAANRLSTETRKLPILSLPAEVTSKRHGIDMLARSFSEDPSDPKRSLWLAEALRRAAKDQRIYAGVRTVIDPSSVVTRAGFHAAARLGDDGRDSTEHRLMRRATALAVERVRLDARDADALHVLARVHLAEGETDHCVRLARLAIAADPEGSGGALVTLARAYQAQGKKALAARTAHAALEKGCTVAYEVLGVLEHDRPSDRDGRARLAGGAERISRAARLLERVTDDDRRAYWGVSASAAGVAHEVAAGQWDKTRATAARMQNTLTSARRR